MRANCTTLRTLLCSTYAGTSAGSTPPPMHPANTHTHTPNHARQVRNLEDAAVFNTCGNVCRIHALSGEPVVAAAHAASAAADLTAWLRAAVSEAASNIGNGGGGGSGGGVADAHMADPPGGGGNCAPAGAGVSSNPDRLASVSVELASAAPVGGTDGDGGGGSSTVSPLRPRPAPASAAAAATLASGPSGEVS
eukprot:356055-Chlamydomonas_euryale.AAC.7